MSDYKLILFDVDGTLADRETSELLPNVKEWFSYYGNEQRVAIVTNQGAAGLHHWMVVNEFGDPEKFPSKEQVNAHLSKVKNELGISSVYVCYAYESKKSGEWSPVPDGEETNYQWNKYYRKPAPGLIHQAMIENKAAFHEVLFVGDSEEDYQAALNAGVQFEYAGEFFGWKAEINEPVSK